MEPHEIEERQFGSTLRGYDRQEVEEFTREVAEHVRRLTKKLAHLERDLEAARSAPPPLPPAQAPPDSASQKPPATQPQKTDVYKQLGEETARILISAEQAANQIKEQAKREAAEVLADARRDAGRIARQAREGKQKAEGDLRQLLQTRSLLADQLEDVRRRLAEAVARLQAPLEPTEPAHSQSGSAPDVPASVAERRPERAAAEPDIRSTEPVGSETNKDEAAAFAEPQTSKPAEQTSRPAAGKPEQPAAENQPQDERGAGSPAIEPALRSIGAASKEPVVQEHRVARMIESTQFPPPRLVPPRPDQPTGDNPQKTLRDAISSKRAAPAAAERSAATRKAEPSRDIVDQLLEEILQDSEEARDTRALKGVPSGSNLASGVPKQTAQPPAEPPGTDSPHPSEARAEPSERAAAPDFFDQRATALAEAPYEAARKLKRLLQEDHNDLLHRLRSQRGRGTLDENIAPESEQLDRFNHGLRPLLHKAFTEGRKAGGALGEGSPDPFLSTLVAKQVVLPLRSEVCRVVEAGLDAKDTPTAISERAGDVFRIWKGVRTELLGEGLVYAAFHEGLLDVWRADSKNAKNWVLSPEEQECPKGVCQSNASQGPVPAGDSFLSGHAGPPAHGGCTCGLAPS